MTTSLRREINALESIAPILSGPGGLTKALQEIVESVTRWTGADRVALIQFDWEAREVHHFLRGGEGWADVITSVGFEELDAGLSGWCLRTGEVALSPRSPPDPRESPEVQNRRTETKCGSIMVAPIGTAHHRLGTITVINRLDQPDFTPEDAENLGLFVQMAGWVIRVAQEAEQAIQARAQARAALLSKTSFLSNLSHELRTPLNGVLGFSHLLDATALDDNQKIMVQTILQSGQRLLGTVDNLLELAQFETGQFHLESAPFSPRVVLESVIAKHTEVTHEKGLKWKISYAPELPLVLEGDAVRIGQAWNHILSNAVKFTDHGGITVHLEARKTAGGRSELILNVADTGIGLSNERSGRWFMPFHQEDGSLTRKFGGTGLGLALCDRIVRKMGGGLSLLGDPGVGTKVRVWVDLSHERGSRRAGAPGLRVLLQDPDPIGSLVVVKMLEKEGHRVDFVTNLAQARERLSSSFYEVLLTEAPSPDPEVLVTLKQESPDEDLHLIGLYPLGSAPLVESRVPWTATLVKPVTYSMLRMAVKRCRPWEDS